MSHEQLLILEVEKICVNPFQPRRQFNQDDLNELASSIKAVGLLHPPLVRPSEREGFYEIVSGERRFRAAQLAGFTKIPVIMRPSSILISAQAALIENVQRVDLNPLEVAQALRKLIVEFGLTQDELAIRVGKKRSTIANFLRLLSLPKKIQQSIEKGDVSMGHAKVILSLPDDEKKEFLTEMIIRDDLTVRQAEDLVSKIIEKEKKAPLNYETRDFYLEELSERLQHKLGTKVTIQPVGKKGRIYIDYYSLDDLDRLLCLLGINDN